MLAADAELQRIACLAPTFRRDADQFADAVAIERDERIDIEDSLGGIGAEEARRIIARYAERGLRQVVRAEREELRRFGELAGLQASARQLDHGADLIVDLRAGLFRDG